MGEKLPEGGEVGVTIIHRRHGPKDETYKTEALSEEGYEHVRKEAREFFEVVRRSPGGTVFSLVSSTIVRAQETKHIFIEEVRSLARDATYGVVMVHLFSPRGRRKTEAEIARITRDTRDRYVIVDELDEPDLGYIRDENDNKEIYDRTREFFGEEESPAFIHAAQPEELGVLIEHLYQKELVRRGEMTEKEKQKLKRDIVQWADPTRYLPYSPERLAIHQLQVFAAHIDRNQTLFHDRRSVSVFFGHAPGCDLLAIALFGERISFASYQKIGGYRKYLEGLSFDVNEHGEVVVVDFRNNRSSVEPVSLISVIMRLEKEHEERLAAWAAYSARMQQAA